MNLSRVSRAEDVFLCVVLAAMALIPLIEALLRPTLKIGISSSASLVQHLVLIAGMAGGAVAARQNRLLALAALELLPGTRWKGGARLFANAMAAAITCALVAASWEFLQLERESGKILAYGVPVWVVQMVMPFGFALVAVRMIGHAAPGGKGRALAAALTALLLVAALYLPVAPATLSRIALIALLLATVFGAPIFTTLGGAALILFWGAGEPISAIPIEHYRLVTNPSLATIPLFTLAGYFLAEGGASRRLVRVFDALVGSFRGGPAIVTALACAFFTSFTGASGVTILALGGLLMPVLIEARYSERAALGLLTGSGSLGLLFPPCLPLILYAIIARIPIEQMFLGGILPGLVMVIVTAIWGARQGPPVPSEKRFNRHEAVSALWAAKWELLLPAVAFGGLMSGLATPVEAAAMTALYALLTESVLHRDLKPRDLVRVTTEAGLLVGGVLLILGVALGFTNYLIDAEIPTMMLDWTTASIHSKWVFLLALNLFLLVVGCLMDIFSATVVVVPLLVPIGEAFGVDPVHLGIVFLANMELGYLTPPVGMNLFLASYRFSKPMHELYRAILPMLVVLLAGVLLITYIPALTTTLPRVWSGNER